MIVPSESLGEETSPVLDSKSLGEEMKSFRIFLKCGEEIDSCALLFFGEEVNSYLVHSRPLKVKIF